jgi:hypothetical protein
MEIVAKPDMVEIHVKVTREELGMLVRDMKQDCTNSDPYAVTREFLNHIASL